MNLTRAEKPSTGSGIPHTRVGGSDPHIATRRAFLQASLATAAATAASPCLAAPSRPARKPTLCLFSKPLGNRPVAQLPPLLHELGCDAIDLTCRPGGHVLPERVADDLPRASEQLTAAGIAIPMLTTAITDADSGHAEAIMRTAAGLNIRFLKLGYYRYTDLGRIEETLREVKARLLDLVMLARDYDLRLGFHNHSGRYVGSPLWDLHQLLIQLPPWGVGSYFDAGHATVEGGDAGWEIGLNLLASRIIMLAVKDMRWVQSDRGWRPQWGPLGEGMVRWPQVLGRLRQAGFAGPVSLHVEYLQPAKPNSAEERRVLDAIARDWRTARELFAQLQ